MTLRSAGGALFGSLAAAQAVAGISPDVPPFGLGAFHRDEPISITADVLEAQDDGDHRTLAFRRGVEVRQGALTLSAAVLEAKYAAGQRQPDQLRAQGDVRIHEGTRRARCREAHYDRLEQHIVCHGEPAELWDGADRLSGGKVAFDLASHRVLVDGGALLEIHRQLDDVAAEQGGLNAEALEQVREGGPILIQAAQLEVSDVGGARVIRFQGDVAVTQGKVQLRSSELEVVYPRGASQPEQLIARQSVVLTEGLREAHCAKAEYRPAERHLVCTGPALLRDGEDRLESEGIVFDLAARRVEAVGRARLWVQPLKRDPEQR